MRIGFKSELGQKGEDAAVIYLKQKGHIILHRNYRVCGNEIDIISRINNTICFIEVKTRKDSDHGFPEEFVDQRKMKRIIRAAKIFYNTSKYHNLKARFDVISVLYKFKNSEIECFENAFEDDF